MRRILIIIITVASMMSLASSPVLAAPPQGLGWARLAPRISPTERAGQAAAFDPVSGKIVIFGGDGPPGYLNDTWTYDGTIWAPVATATAPPPRTAAGMAYDEVTKKLVLFGGYDGVNWLGDTWVFDGRRYFGDTWAFGPGTTRTPTVQVGSSPGGRWVR